MSRLIIRETMLWLAREKLAQGEISTLGLVREWIRRNGPFTGQRGDVMSEPPVSLCGDPGAEISINAIEALHETGADMVPQTPEQFAAVAMLENIGCLDDWPRGQELGYAVYDEIPWRLPEGGK